MTWWVTPAWYEYELACGHALGTRAHLLAEAPWQTRMIDLTLPHADLWRGVRRSYHAIINRLSREYQEWTPESQFAVDPRSRERWVIDGPGAGFITRTCELLHKADAGRQTRSDASWQLLGDWAENGRGLFAVALDFSQPPDKRLLDASPLIVDGQALEMGDPMPIVGYVYFWRHGGWAYYASAASLQRDINIALVWWAILALKARGVSQLEMGWQGEATTAKGKQIEFFRRGFGGVDIPAREASTCAL